MAVNLGRAVLYLVGDDSGLGKTLDKVGGALKTGLAVGIGAAVAGTAALVAGLVDATKAAMEAELVQADLNAVLKSTGGIAGVTADMANKLADSLSQVTMFEDDVILAGESMLLTFTNIGSEVFPMATEAMLNMAQKMGTDPTQAAIQLGKALNDPIAGLTALAKVGVKFTDAQKEQIKAMVEAGDVAGAQKIILAELEKEFGGVAQAAGGTLTGQLTILKNQFGNVKEEIGSALIPIISDLAKEYGPQLISFAKDGAQWMKENLVPALKDVVEWLKIYLPPAIQFLTDTWNQVLKPVLLWLWDFLLVSLIPAGVIVVAWLKVAIPEAIKWAVEAWAKINKAIGDVKGFIDDAIGKFNEIKNFLAGIRLPNPFQFILDAIDKIRNFQFPSWATGLVSGFATGTPYFPGGLALVGEQGPEIVALPRGSAIYPNGSGPGGGGNVSIVINAPGGDPYAVRGAVLSGLEAARNRGWR